MIRSALRLLKAAMAVGLLVHGAAHADLRTAEKNYRQAYQVEAGTQFLESPFNGYYMLVDPRGGLRLFTQDLDFSGFDNQWEMKNEGKTIVLTGAAIEVMRANLRKALKTNWMVPTDLNSGERNIVVVTAPNCPSCKIQDKDFARFGQALGARVSVVPTLLGPGNSEFTNGVMCSSEPARTWKEATSTGRYVRSAAQCERALWARTVMTHTFATRDDGRTVIRTPAAIRPDGSVLYGWVDTKDAAVARKALGL